MDEKLYVDYGAQMKKSEHDDCVVRLMSHKSFSEIAARQDEIWLRTMVRHVQEQVYILDVVTYAEQIDKIQARLSHVEHWRLVDFTGFRPKWPSDKFPSYAFRYTLDKFAESQKKWFDGFDTREKTNSLDSLIMLCLWHQYDEELLIRVMKAWIGNSASNSMYDFVNLLKHWEDFDKTPVEWALQVLGVHRELIKYNAYPFMSNKEV